MAMQAKYLGGARPGGARPGGARLGSAKTGCARPGSASKMEQQFFVLGRNYEWNCEGNYELHYKLLPKLKFSLSTVLRSPVHILF